jgi:hypothetical protein
MSSMWDIRVARTAAFAVLLAFAFALLVTAATDEGGVAWAVRIARSLGALPACAGFAAWIGLRNRRGRGELRALATLGHGATRAGLPAVAGACLVATVLTAAVTAAPSFDVDTFFPVMAHGQAPPHAHVEWQGSAFVDTERGVRILPNGSIERTTAPGSGSDAGAAKPGRAGARATIAIVSLLMSASLALFFARAGVRDRAAVRRRDLAAMATAAGATIVLFHFAAIGRAPLAASVFPAIALSAFAVRRYRAESWDA